MFMYSPAQHILGMNMGRDPVWLVVSLYWLEAHVLNVVGYPCILCFKPAAGCEALFCLLYRPTPDCAHCNMNNFRDVRVSCK
jgi:hypothetical protein